MERMDTDVLVMGAGLAGITAAIWAASSGAKVCIAANGAIGSGSSFYPGTWGLGLIGPESKEDEKDLLNVILEIGEGMADKELAGCLVSKVAEGISELKELGAEINDAVNKGEREFIPCFDKKCREWHGIGKDRTKNALLMELERLGVQMLPETAVTDILLENGQVSGAEAVKNQDGSLLLISCKALVIAGGGLGGLFSYRLNTSDVTGIGQFLAVKAGASLINLEFMQIMPGFLRPAPKTIYNEKVFRYSEFSNPKTGKSIFADWSKEELVQRMEIRSGHGPFTSRLPSAPVDIRMFQECLANPDGILLTYKKELNEHQPEFVKTYFQWLKQEKGLTINDPVYLGVFAHASNGGIRINTRAETGVNGLYACGEATGGMHGADRLGGLSTANALVFGKIAGIQAAKWSSQHTADKWENGNGKKRTYWIVPDAAYILEQIRELNYHAALVIREEHRILEAMEKLEQLQEKTLQQRRVLGFRTGMDIEMAAGTDEKTLWQSYKTTRELEAAFTLSQALLQAVRLRRESRGSHFRLDYPQKDERLNTPIIHQVRMHPYAATYGCSAVNERLAGTFTVAKWNHLIGDGAFMVAAMRPLADVPSHINV